MTRVYSILGIGLGILMMFVAIYHAGYSDGVQMEADRQHQAYYKLQLELNKANEQAQKQTLTAQRIQDDADKQLADEKHKQQAMLDSLNRSLVAMRDRVQSNTTAAGNDETVSDDAGIKCGIKTKSDSGRERALDKCLESATALAIERDEIAIQLNTLIDVYEKTKDEINHGSEPKRFNN